MTETPTTTPTPTNEELRAKYVPLGMCSKDDNCVDQVRRVDAKTGPVTDYDTMWRYIYHAVYDGSNAASVYRDRVDTYLKQFMTVRWPTPLELSDGLIPIMGRNDDSAVQYTLGACRWAWLSANPGEAEPIWPSVDTIHRLLPPGAKLYSYDAIETTIRLCKAAAG